MGMPQIITVKPVMNADAEEVKVKHPSHKIGTIFWSEFLFLFPFDLRHDLL